ncbi:twin-arginine translocase TatA/TatE family subunit [Arthrobacter echini]|uniref:Sec-independent protein translocase protein TatA n=1 Tax=Arthrobacter echini TaxID=1529066 RepID=A0A5D0XRY8_9MICC|nr:Sec-independent protein translocase subunit TatA [Arthrobacter echini]TYC99339.1 twin-arginine translocase TatA/TatE family subunit [Arthrobacter echini]
MRLEGWHIVIIVVLAIVLFGAPKLPGLARSVGQSLRIFKSEVKQMKDENGTDETGTDPVEGRVVGQSRDTYASTQRDPGHGSTGYGSTGHEATGQPPHRAGDDPGPAQQSGSSHTNR